MFSKLRNKVNEYEEYFIKEIKILKANQTEIPELKNSINEMKNALECIGNRAGYMGELVNLKIEI